MNLKQEKKYIDILFDASLMLKGIHAVLELAAGFFVLFVNQAFILKMVAFLTQEELAEDPKDPISHFIINAAQHFTAGNRFFLLTYLFSHALVRLFLVYGLLKEKVWAYPASYVVLGGFIVYQLYRYSYTHSVWLLLLSLFDLFVIWLVWKEHSYVIKKKRFKQNGV